MRLLERAILGAAVLAVIGVLLGCGGGSSSPTNPIATPVISSISPQSGAVGTEVTITGSNFGAVQGNSTVNFNGILAPVIQPWTNTRITAAIPAGAKTDGKFVVIVNGYYSNESPQFTLAGPSFSGLSPISGTPGTQVTITGSGFGTSQGTSYVSFNGQTAAVTIWTDTSIVCTVPTTGLQSGGVSVVVVVGGRQSNYQTFNVAIPQISYINPAEDNPGATVTIYGQGFGTNSTLSNTYVRFGTTTVYPKSWSDTSLLLTIPNFGLSAGQQSVVVVVNGQSSNTGYMTVSAPRITGIYNSSGLATSQFASGNQITVRGNFFGAANEAAHSVLLRSRNSGYPDLPVSSFSSWDDTQFTFTCPDNGLNVGYISYDPIVTVGGISGSGDSYVIQID